MATKGNPECDGDPAHGGFNLNMWGTIVNRDGVVCAVAHTGDERGDQWPGSRVISAQKANTANAFSLDGFALSTANLWGPTRDQGSLADLTESNPFDTKVAYRGPSKKYGTRKDPMVGRKIGGVNDFGGGLGLYNGSIIGGVGVSGDSSCEDHAVAWDTRANLALDNVPGAIGDEMIFSDSANADAVASGFIHPHCLGHVPPMGAPPNILGNDTTGLANGFVD